MDRTAFAACAGMLVPIGAALGICCGVSYGHQAPVARADAERPTADIRPMQLPLAARRVHAPETAAAIRRADLRVREGFTRAARGAHYSARNDFESALLMIARARDAGQNAQPFSRALSTGLVALRESSDFVRRGPENATADLHRVVARHETTILKDVDLQALTPAVAAERYRVYAQEQIAQAVAGEQVGSMALFGLAKVALVADSGDPRSSVEQRLRAAALYKAALLADAGNFCAANELAVLMAQDGQLEQARDLLIRCVSVSSHAVTWRNLSTVHARLGEDHLARQAQLQADKLPQARVSASEPDVKWVDPQTFAQVTSASDAVMPVSPIAASSGAIKTPAPVRPQTSVAKQPKTDWIPWSSRR